MNLFKLVKPLWIVVALFLVLPGCSTGPEHEMVGSRAPDFTLDCLDGDKISMADLTGKPVLLEFWAPWCSGCLKNIEPLKKLHSRFNAEIHLIAASSEQGHKSMQNFSNRYHIPYQITFSNQELLNSYQVNGIPVTILIDANGVIRDYHIGQFSYERMAKKIQELL